MNTGNSVGVIGLGRMGLPLCENLRDKNYDVIGYDLAEENRHKIESLKMIQLKIYVLGFLHLAMSFLWCPPENLLIRS